jgi:hypothetical protein
LNNSLNVLRLVLVSDVNFLSAGYQINSATLAKLLIIDREGKLNDSFDVIVPVGD